MPARPFLIATTIDFPDDCRSFAFTPDMLTQLLDRFQWLGVRRVYYNYYAMDGMWQVFASHAPSTAETLATLGNPMPLLSRMAHDRGMEFFAIIKPYETGMSNAFHRASPQARNNPGLPCLSGVYTELEDWVKARPELRVKARSGDIPQGLAAMPVTRIQLRQRDMAPIRIRPENLEIWTSPDNGPYHKQDLDFTVTEAVETAPHDVVDIYGHLVTRQGDSVRVLNITGLHLLDPFIAVTTNLDDNTGTFRNTATAMLRAFGPDDRPLPIIIGSHKSVWRLQRNFRTDDLAFDAGVGDSYVCLDVTNQRTVCPHCVERGIADCGSGTIFPDTPICRDGVVAFAKGRNEYLSGSLCEGYPEVQAYWLSWISECIAAGVDGVDVRISNHSSWTDTPNLFGFNAPVLAEYQRRYGVNPDTEPYDPELLGEVRGDLYDTFLRAAKRRLNAAGKALHLHIEVESFRPDAPQMRWRTRPGNMVFHWRRWLREGLPAEVLLMGASWTPERLLADPTVQGMIQETVKHGIPAHMRRFMWWSRDGKVHADTLEHVYQHDSIAGYNLYETASFFDNHRLGPEGQLLWHPGMAEEIRARIQHLGISQ